MSTLARRERERTQRRTSIIDAAEKLFSSNGFDNISMNEIANEVELNRATIYLYFENKEALCIAVILRGVSLLHDMVMNRVESSVISQKIKVFGTSYITFFNLYPQYIHVYNLFQAGRFDLSNLKNQTCDDVGEIRKLEKNMFDKLVSVIGVMLENGTISSDVDPVYTSILIISAIEKTINPPLFLEKELEKKELNHYFTNFINQLLISEPVKDPKQTPRELKISKNQMKRLKR
jgi:TetR/AcrR family transcriptional regulator